MPATPSQVYYGSVITGKAIRSANLTAKLNHILEKLDLSSIEKNDKVYMKHHKTLIEKSKHYGVIYEKTLKALYTVLSGDFDVSSVETPQTPAQSCFLNSIGSEMTIDCKTGDCHGSAG